MGNLLSQFDDLIKDLAHEEDSMTGEDIGPCFFCGKNAQCMLVHDDAGCRIPSCRDCGEQIVMVVGQIAAILELAREEQNWDTEYQQVAGYLDEENWMCRICQDTVHFSTVRLEDPTDDDKF